MQGDKVRAFYTATTFGTPRPGAAAEPAVIATTMGQIKAAKKGVSFSHFGEHKTLLRPDLNLPADHPEAPQPGQNLRQFQAYSHYIQPGGLAQSFIDNVDGRRGGTLSPTVKINNSGATSEVDHSFGNNGLGPYAYLPTNKQKTGVRYVN